METSQPKEETKRAPREPEKEIKVSSKGRATAYVGRAKESLKVFGEIEMHALGNAVTTLAIAAENLERYLRLIKTI